MNSRLHRLCKRLRNLNCELKMTAFATSGNAQPLPKAPTEPSRDDRIRLARMLTTLFEHWQLSVRAQCDLLGLHVRNRSAIYRYRLGSPVPASRDQLERVGLLFGIHARLQTLFPGNRDLAYAWMTRGNRAFDGQAPVAVASSYGIAGLHMLHKYLHAAC
jgi:hypothetical protein